MHSFSYLPGVYLGLFSGLRLGLAFYLRAGLSPVRGPTALYPHPKGYHIWTKGNFQMCTHLLLSNRDLWLLEVRLFLPHHGLGILLILYLQFEFQGELLSFANSENRECCHNWDRNPMVPLCGQSFSTAGSRWIRTTVPWCGSLAL